MPQQPDQRSDTPSGIDPGEYRFNVAALIRVPSLMVGLCEGQAYEQRWRYLLCKRSDHGAWQCPQGGLEPFDACVRSAMLRELQEEIGVAPEHVQVIHESPCWRRYDFVHQKMRSDVSAGFCGQQQKWFLCQIADLSHCDLARAEGEFEEVSLFAAGDLLQMYAVWKRSPFLDFCREIGLFPSALGAPFHGDPK